MARPTRVIYAENDPTLRGMITNILEQRPELTVVLSAESSSDVLASDAALVADVALLDLALGPDSLTGVELGIALRQRNENIGIVIYSQHAIPDYVRHMQEHISQAWSFVEKTGNLNFDELVSVLRETAAGKSFATASNLASHDAVNLATNLSPRQHEIMSLAVQGMDAPTIAKELGLASVTVRKNLSRIYEILVPNPSPGTDLRTTAVLRYAQQVRPGLGAADAF